MAKAARSLSPKQILERMQRHRLLAHQSATKAIKAKLIAQGVRLTDVTAKDISISARAWLDAQS